jgi:hypothetical protein
MDPIVDPFLTRADTIVLENLLLDVHGSGSDTKDDAAALERVIGLSDETRGEFESTIFTAWDIKDIHLPPILSHAIVQPYIRWAQTIVRHKTDVVFLTHTLLYLSTSVPSALFLFYNFTYAHAICHCIMTGWYCGAFTLMLHNHIHNNGVLAKRYALIDRMVPYILEPLMGHTWDSYFYHHVKHHHCEGNGPDDISSTVRYQRDSLVHLSCYIGRIFTLIYIELPLYFIHKKRYSLATKLITSELANYAFIVVMAQHNFRAALFTLILPLILMRIGLMVGNWGQHAFVDEEDPNSDFRSSITLIDVPSNRYCFNDGYHTSHHLNPLRHWRDHPAAFLEAKHIYASEHALVLCNIDYIMITYRLMRKDYDHLAKCLVPIGEQIKMSHEERMEMLRSKTRRFTEEDIRRKFRKQ